MKPRVIAHRGCSRFAPENTIASLLMAHELGVDAVEMDLRVTADGELVLMHDEKVDRTTDGKGAVAELSLDAIRRLDAGSWKSPEFRGERVPRFVEALESIPTACGVLAEIKVGPMGEKLARATANMNVRDRLIFLCWDKHPELTADIRHHLPGVPVLELGNTPDDYDSDFFGRKRVAGVKGLDYRFGTLSVDFVKAAHESAMSVYTWTVNEPAEMRRAIRMGVDGITTDDPGLLRRVLADRA